MDDLIKKYNELKVASELSFEEVASLKNIMGVYMIYDNNNSLLYIGKTNKFNIRFGTDLKHESTHTLVSKLINNGSFEDRYQVKDFLINKCCFRIMQCNSNREAEALEHLAIYLLNPLMNK